MPFRLTRITFHASPGKPGDASPVTILVGPNNSGKSLALREIMSWASGQTTENHVVDELDVEWPATPEEVLSYLEPFEASPGPGEMPQENSVLYAPFKLDGAQNRFWLNKGSLPGELARGSESGWLRQSVLGHFTARLDGRTRFDLIQARGYQDLQLPPQHHLGALFKNDDLRQRVRDMVVKAFPDRYFVIDPTSMQQFRVRFSSRPPADSDEERNWTDRAIDFHAKAEPIEQLSDGVVCFTGLVAAAISLPHRILLVDEPEAFLHPPLARLLGSNLASLTKERDASLVVATHSPEFVMGCMESGIDTTIVRLSYEREVASARMLAPAELKELSRNPLLRSTKALSGLFHRGVVVGESDHDRAFYDEINRRLVSVGRGTADTFFTNAQNWQTIPRIVGPLRKLGVPAAAIIDLDSIVQPKREWNKIYKVMAIDEAAIERLDAMRQAIGASLDALPRDSEHPSYKKGGISLLSEDHQKSAKGLFDELAKYGIFVVDVGELESWLSVLKIQAGGDKGRWIVEVFAILGAIPGSKNYVEAGRDDVWAFMDKVASWINDPKRLGLTEAS